MKILKIILILATILVAIVIAIFVFAANKYPNLPNALTKCEEEASAKLEIEINKTKEPGFVLSKEEYCKNSREIYLKQKICLDKAFIDNNLDEVSKRLTMSASSYPKSIELLIKNCGE